LQLSNDGTAATLDLWFFGTNFTAPSANLIFASSLSGTETTGSATLSQVACVGGNSPTTIVMCPVGSPFLTNPGQALSGSASAANTQNMIVASLATPYAYASHLTIGLAANTNLNVDSSQSLSPVPDGGITLMLLGGALVGLESLRRKFRA
jgi:hypothetical protein